jgi:hypothetical protein
MIEFRVVCVDALVLMKGMANVDLSVIVYGLVVILAVAVD